MMNASWSTVHHSVTWPCFIAMTHGHMTMQHCKLTQVIIVNLQCVTTRTHTRLTALCLGLPGWAGTRKVNPIWILLKQESEWQWHQLGHMQVCTSLQTDDHASTPPLSFLHVGCPSCRPTNSVKALKTVLVIKNAILSESQNAKNGSHANKCFKKN